MEKLTAEQILEGNRAIAEFLELKMHDSLSIAKTPLKCYEFNYALHSPHALQFHTSWDWLMPVVAKINKIVEKMADEQSNMDGFVCKSVIDDELSYGIIEPVYQSVVKFIEWHNTLPSTPEV